MQHDRYSVRIGESKSIAEDLSYDALVNRIVEFTVRAAVARQTDQSDWEHDELRRKGVSSLQLFRNGKAVWENGPHFEAELAEARRERAATKFLSNNQLDPLLYERVEEDLRNRWRRAGYYVCSLAHDMKKLFTELERDIAERATDARERLIAELVEAQP